MEPAAPRNPLSVNTGIPLPVWTILLQLLMGMIIAVVLLFIGWDQLIAGLLALGVVVIPNAFFARAILNSRLQARGILLQQVWKVAFNLVLMTAVMVTFRPSPLGFFLTLLALPLAYVLAPLLAAPGRHLQRQNAATAPSEGLTQDGQYSSRA